MPEKLLRVRAATGQVLGWPDGRIGYVGLTIAPPGTPEEQIHTRVPNGPAYLALAETTVPNERFYRRAIEQGSLLNLDAQPKLTPEQAAKPERNVPEQPTTDGAPAPRKGRS